VAMWMKSGDASATMRATREGSGNASRISG
jgi:hypothetical protein